MWTKICISIQRLRTSVPPNFTDDLTCLQPHRGDIFVAAGKKNELSSVGAAFI